MYVCVYACVCVFSHAPLGQARRKEKKAITELKKRYSEGRMRFTDNENVHTHTTLVRRLLVHQVLKSPPPPPRSLLGNVNS